LIFKELVNDALYEIQIQLHIFGDGDYYMSTENKQQLEQQLWKIADTLRGKMDADDFRDYILGFIFYKYLSEKMHAYANDILKPDKITYDEVEKHKDKKELLAAVKDEALDKLGYFLKPSELFSELARRGNSDGKNKFILDDLSKVLTNIEQSTMGSESEEDFGNLFEDLDLTSSKLGKSESDKNELIVKVLSHLDEIDFDLKNTESDVLGDAYEYLIGKFASGAGKKAGEFYTPQQVSSVLARIVTVGKTKLKSVYDPTCGSGSLLLRVAKEVKDKNIMFYGQESNPTTYNLCRMNMIMHDVHYKKFDIKNEDTLERPQHFDLRFEAIVANPPFSAEWSASPLHMSNDRFAAYGKLAPKGTADFAFVQHMVHQLDDKGTMACVLPHGVLFRGGAEGHIREHLIKDKNYLDAVIGLPANIFYGTSIPTCILVLKKKREHGDNVLFIDASQHFEKVKTQNYLRKDDINKIITAYKTRSAEEKYSHLATLKEIAENDYNLNIPRYVDTFEEEEQVNLKAITKELRSVAETLQATDKEIAKYCKELGIDTPF
jgi:type I restriction enzyme M protein